MRKRALTFFIIFMVGGLLLSAGAWLLPPVEVPAMAPGGGAMPEKAEHIQALEQERDLREVVQRGNIRGLNWGLTFAQIALTVMALDLLFQLVTGRPGPIQRMFDRIFWRRRRTGVRGE